MELTKKELIALIQNIVFKVTNVKIENESDNLLDNRFHIHPVDFLYIFDALENELNIPVVNILKKHDYTVMKLDSMSDALLELF